jgi:diguanylate cyclase (GGDEF)-like protein/putative nucleotidyltransferase with HDIG domain
MLSLSFGRWVFVITAATASGGLAEAWLRPSAPFLITPLVLSAVALVFAFRVHLREEARQRRHQQQLQQSFALQLTTIEALALAIDARDRSSQSQLRREQQHAGALARAFGMPEDEVEGVRTAALLHDIGKLAVPDHILTKTGPLTEEERAKFRVHAAVGAGIIANVPFPYPVASLVLSHHERWDGTGYPAGLRGSDIPLGARILAAVNHFAAVTSNRAFNQALPVDEAIGLLWSEAGKAFDPAVVARYVELLPALLAETADTWRPEGMALPGGAKGSARATAAPVDSAAAVLDHIGLASQELQGLYEVAQAMGTSLGVAESMTVIASKLNRLVPFSTCALFLRDAANGIARCRFATGVGEQAFTGLVVRDGPGLVGAAMSRRECVISLDPGADFDPARPGLGDTGLQSALVCPLIMSGAVIGALALYHTTPGYYAEDHRRLALRVSDQVAAVINNAVVFEQTREDSVTDPLTGLPNARFLYAHVGRELSRAARLNASMAVLLLDLDNMKSINDGFGHHAGNRALCAVASVLRSAIRPYDICVRCGGDEFVVLLSDCGADQAEAKRLELQRAVEGIPFSVGEVLRVTLAISVGAAVFPADGETYDELLEVADSRMYRDKAERKHRAVAGAQEPA